jgi:hypothetical protein
MRQATSSSTPPLCPPDQTTKHVSLSLNFVESPGEPATPPVHPCHLSTPYPCRPRRSGHVPVLHPTHTSGRFRPCIRAQHHPTTPLAQPRLPSSPLDPLARRRTPTPCCHVRTVGTTVSTCLDACVPPKRLLHACNTLAALFHRPSQLVDAQGTTTAPADQRGHHARIKGPVPLSLSLFPSFAPPPQPQHLSEHPPKLLALPCRGELWFA